MAVEFNANFNRFVDFATALKGSGKAIADAANGKFDVNGLARDVVVASGDKVGAMFRSQTAKDVNNVTRDTFRNAVVDMFGGESKIPDSVKEAMEMKNFDGSGRPLTAKRIMIVKAAIDKYNDENAGLGADVKGPGSNIINQGLEENAAKMNGVKAMSAASAAKAMQPAALTQKQADKMIDKSLALLGYTFSKEDKAEFAAMLMKYGQDMPVKNQRILSNYIVNKAITDGIDEEDVAAIAKEMKTWSEFKFGDSRLNQLSAKFIERQNAFIKEMLEKPDEFSGENNDVFKQVAGDAERANWNLNGKALKMLKNPPPDAVQRRKQEVVDALLNAVKNPNARKVISILMNQANLADVEIMIRKGGFVVGDAKAADLQTEDSQTIPGADMFVSRSGDSSILADFMPSYGFEISKDGKTATVTVSIDKDIPTNGSSYNDYKIGTAKITQKTKIDLTKPMPEVVDVTFSQVYSNDKIRHAEGKDLFK